MGIVDWIWIQLSEQLGQGLGASIIVGILALWYALRRGQQWYKSFEKHSTEVETRIQGTTKAVLEVRDEVGKMRENNSSEHNRIFHRIGWLEGRAGRNNGDPPADMHDSDVTPEEEMDAQS